jgi:hypothetical protein
MMERLKIRVDYNNQVYKGSERMLDCRNSSIASEATPNEPLVVHSIERKVDKNVQVFVTRSENPGRANPQMDSLLSLCPVIST